MRLWALLSALLICFPAFAAEDIVGFWPQGFTRYCKETPDQCLPRKVAAPVHFLQWESTLDDVNREVNAAIKYRLDPPNQDHFDDGPEFGDCDDYALTKRNILLKRGFDPSNLLFVYVYLHGLNSLHTTLVVRTDYGMMVMDNRFEEPYDLDRLMIDWGWMQTPQNPKIWLPINPD